MAQENEELQDGQPLLKSQNCDIVSFVLFQSRIERPVELLWVNYAGKVVNFFTMNYGDTYHVDTFVTHPWIVWDAETHERYLLNRKPVLFPSPFDPNNPLVLVTLDIPVYSLRERGLQAVRGCVDEHVVDQLELPRTLLRDLKNPPCPGFQYENEQEEQENQ